MSLEWVDAPPRAMSSARSEWGQELAELEEHRDRWAKVRTVPVQDVAYQNARYLRRCALKRGLTVEAAVRKRHDGGGWDIYARVVA